MNTYDPAARILYVHVCRGTESWAAPSGSGHTHRKCPPGPQSPSQVDDVDRLHPAQ